VTNSIYKFPENMLTYKKQDGRLHCWLAPLSASCDFRRRY